jgi:hypothetical protein
VVTALAADEFKRAGVAAFQLALLDVGRLAPQAGRIAVAQQASNGECHDTLAVDARPRVTGIVRAARYRNAIRTISRANVGFGVQVYTSH